MRIHQNFKKRSHCFLYISFVLFIILSSVYLASVNLDKNQNSSYIENMSSNGMLNTENLKLSSNGRITLNLTEISQNTTIVRRVFQSINFTINTTGFTNVNFTQIVFPDAISTVPINMSQSVGENWTYVYTPAYNAPLGFHEVSFLIYNKSEYQLNTQKTNINFTIIPNVVVNLNKYLYNLGETVSGELVVYDLENLNWTVSVSTGTNPATESILFDIESPKPTFSFSFALDSRFSFNRAYYVKVNVTDKAVINQTRRYFEFFIQNSAPSINQSSIEVSPNQIKRSENVTIRFDAYDLESLAELNASLTIKDSEGGLVATYKDDQLTDYDNGTFEKTFEISKSRPLGQYRINITVYDPQLREGSSYAYFTVTNNAPKIQNYTINDFTNNESITVIYGEDLVFKFNVTDEENTIDYITVAIINEDNEWFNISKKYVSVNFSITIRTVDLKTGLWNVYVFATDVDGATVSLSSDLNIAPQEIRIEPNFFDEFYPWLMFIIGLAIGGAIASIIVLCLASRKKRKLPTTPEELPGELKEKKVKEGEVEIEKKRKRFKKERKAKKDKVKETEELRDKEKPEEKPKIEESKEEKEEPKKKEPKSEITRRKIKRKLK